MDHNYSVIISNASEQNRINSNEALNSINSNQVVSEISNKSSTDKWGLIVSGYSSKNPNK